MTFDPAVTAAALDLSRLASLSSAPADVQAVASHALLTGQSVAVCRVYGRAALLVFSPVAPRLAALLDRAGFAPAAGGGAWIRVLETVVLDAGEDARRTAEPRYTLTRGGEA